MVRELRAASNDYKEDERVVDLKDKFVECNNVSNWLAETVFQNPNASLYNYVVQKSNEYNRGKRRRM